MDIESARLLLKPQTLELINSLADADLSDELKLVSKLRQDHDAETVAIALTQAKLRIKAAAKFGPFAKKMLFTKAGLEQATRLSVAAQKAKRFQDASIATVADLGCGLGADAMAMAGLGIEVTAVESDELTAALTSFNISGFGIKVVNADAEEFDLSGFEGLYFDPARRELTGSQLKHRRLSPADYSPNLDWVFSQAKLKPSAIKVAPGFDHELIPTEFEAQWVSDGGDLVELVLYSNQLRNSTRSALLLSPAGNQLYQSLEIQAPRPETRELGQYLYEPDNSLIRSSLMGPFAIEHDLGLISADIAYLTGSDKLETPWLRGFEITEVLALDESKIKKRARELEIGILEIKKRGVDIDPAVFRKKLGLKGPNAASLILTKLNGARVAILGKPIH